MRGKQLVQLVSSLRSKTGRSLTATVGADETATLKAILADTQEQLYDGFAWPFLRQWFSISLAAGQRYYDVPAGLNLERIERVVVNWNTQVHDLERGISFEHYAVHDSDNDSRSSPAAAWDLRWTGSATQIEVWPLPDNTNYTVRIAGIRNLRPLLADSDVADLDDQLITLYAAAELLTRSKSPDAQAKLQLAQRREAQVKANLTSASPIIAIGQGTPHAGRRPSVLRVAG